MARGTSHQTQVAVTQYSQKENNFPTNEPKYMKYCDVTDKTKLAITNKCNKPQENSEK